ncbi:hypothetical protein ACH5RR_009036 [Cinchona calisaya]|uniref:Uncharacterized protein n=1 Tax=Cinchona calisaya TaxID=153742 RepID=A0ABD3AEU3_9GENT
MFQVHQHELGVNLFVFHVDIIPGKVGQMMNNNDNGYGQENLGIDKNVGREQDHVEMIMVDNDDYFSSSDESWILALNNDEDDGVSGETLSASDTDKSGIDFSDFEENVDGDIVSDFETDEASDPMKAAMRSKMWT